MRSSIVTAERSCLPACVRSTAPTSFGHSPSDSNVAEMIAHQPGVAIRAPWGATLISCSRWRAWTRS